MITAQGPRSGLLAAAVAGSLLAGWAVAVRVATLTADAPTAHAVSAVGLSVMVLCGAGAALLRVRRTAREERLERHLWRWIALGTLSWGVMQSVTGWRGWIPVVVSGQARSVDVLTASVTDLLALVAFLPVALAAVSAAGAARDLLDSALLTAAACSAAWFVILSPLPPTGAVGPLSALTTGVLVVELFLVALVAQAVARTRRAHPGLVAVCLGVVLLVAADLLSAAWASPEQRAPGDAVEWAWAGGMALLVIASQRPARARRATETGLEDRRDLLEGGVLPCAAALLALASSLPLGYDGERGGAVGAWLHVTVLALMVTRVLLLIRDGDRLTRGLAQRVEERTRSLRSEERRFASRVVHSSDVVAVVDARGVFTYVSPSLERLVGHPAEQVVGRDAALLLDQPGTRTLHDALRTAHEGQGTREVRVETAHAGGRQLVLDIRLTSRLDDPAVRGVVLNGHDVTESVQLQEELSRQAFSDALTGLPNRALFRDRLEHALRSRGARGPVEVCYLDLDGFKAVNDSLGHGAGDELLVAVAERLRAVVRDGDTVARLGGDEFAVLLEEEADTAAAERLAQRVCDAVRRPFTVRGVEVHVATSVGLASTETSSHDAEQLMRSADLAMYQAKSERQGGYARYHPRMHEQLLERVQLEADLRRAVEQGQFRVVYQPLVDMGDGGVSGVEALVRWDHPERGVISPDRFIPLAESTGLIDAIGAYVLREACQRVATWRAEVPGAQDMRLSVNLSGHQLADPDLRDAVLAVLDETGIPAASLVLEITESVIVDQDETALATLNALRALGVRLAIDDFGTGYSSLSYLHRLPVDILKIDKSFVDRLSTDGDLSLVEAILGMASALSLTTVAEGVEHEHQRAALAAQGCHTGQGYHFSPPVEAAAVPEIITTALRVPGARRGPATGAPTAVEVAR